jgi:hypothetical protein
MRNQVTEVGLLRSLVCPSHVREHAEFSHLRFYSRDIWRSSSCQILEFRQKIAPRRARCRNRGLGKLVVCQVVTQTRYLNPKKSDFRLQLGRYGYLSDAWEGPAPQTKCWLSSWSWTNCSIAFYAPWDAPMGNMGYLHKMGYAAGTQTVPPGASVQPQFCSYHHPGGLRHGPVQILKEFCCTVHFSWAQLAPICSLSRSRLPQRAGWRPY